MRQGAGHRYVLGGAGVNELHRFRSWKDAKPVASLKLPTFKHPLFTAVMALDAAATPPVLWVGTHQGTYARYSLLRIEDKEPEFATPVDIGKDLAASRPSAGAVINLELDHDRNRRVQLQPLCLMALNRHRTIVSGRMVALTCSERQESGVSSAIMALLQV